MDVKLLVVDDDVNICDMLKLYFENEGNIISIEPGETKEWNL